MSFAFDTLSAALELLFDEVDADEKVTWRIRNLVGSMHEANHREDDAINKDSMVTDAAFFLKAALAGTNENKVNRHLRIIESAKINFAHGILISALEKLLTDDKIFRTILDLIKSMNYADWLRGDYISNDERVEADARILKETLEEIATLNESSQHSN